MLLFFRFLRVFVFSLLRSRIGPIDASVVSFRVWPHDCDLNLHLNAGRYLSLMDAARTDLIGRLGLIRPLVRHHWRPIMGGCTMRYRREIGPFETFRIRSRIIGWDEKWFYVEHVVEKDVDTFCAVGIVRTLVRGPAGNISPSAVFALVGHGEAQSPELPEYVVRWRDAEDAR